MSQKFQECLVDWQMVDELMFTAEIENYSEVQLNAVMGSLMGDGYLYVPSSSGKSSIRWNQSYKQHEYNLHRYQVLSEHATKEPTKKPNPGYGDFWSVFQLTSSDTLGLLYAMMHKTPESPKTITPTFLAAITHPIALAWWFMDDGSRSTGLNHGQIATNGFSFDEVYLIQDWLKTRWDLEVRYVK